MDVLNKTPESCQINWLAAGGPGEEGYEVVVVVVVVGGGVLGPGIHAREPQRGMCVSHCVIIPVPALPEQNLAHPARGVLLEPFIKHCPAVSEQEEPLHGWTRLEKKKKKSWHLVILND